MRGRNVKYLVIESAIRGSDEGLMVEQEEIVLEISKIHNLDADGGKREIGPPRGRRRRRKFRKFIGLINSTMDRRWPDVLVYDSGRTAP